MRFGRHVLYNHYESLVSLKMFYKPYKANLVVLPYINRQRVTNNVHLSISQTCEGYLDFPYLNKFLILKYFDEKHLNIYDDVVWY